MAKAIAVRILLADDHALFRAGVKQLFAHLDRQIETVEVATGTEAIRLAQAQTNFDLVLIDLAMPDVNGFAGLAAFRAHAPSVPVVVLSGSEDPADVQAAIDGGAAGFIPKSSNSEVILSALRLVLAGGVYAPPELLVGAGQASSKQIAALTPRQREVLVLLGQGKSNKEIGSILNLTEGTVKQHVSAILKTLGVTSRIQAAIAGRHLRPASGA